MYIHLICLLLGVVGLINIATAQSAKQLSTPGGTVIENKATGSFIPTGGGAAETTESNTVTTTVNTVYSFSVTPDSGDTPVGANATASDFSGTPDTTNDLNSTPLGTASVTFVYTLENNTNVDISVALAVMQDNSDDMDLQNIQIAIDKDGDKMLDPAQDDVVTGPVNLTQAGSTPDSGEYNDTVTLLVKGDIPTTAEGGFEALLDLVATNLTAVADGLTTNDTGPPYKVRAFDNNNIARVVMQESADIQVSKSLSQLVNNEDGTYALRFKFMVENTGNSTVTNVQIADDIDTQLALNSDRSANQAQVTAIALVSNSTNLTPNAQLTTVTNDNLLGGTDSLGPGEMSELVIDVTLNVTASTLPIDPTNSAQVSAKDVTGGAVGPNASKACASKPSDPTCVVGPTSAAITAGSEGASIGLAKNVAANVVDNRDGSYNISFNLYVKNIGQAALSSVQIKDDLQLPFGQQGVNSTNIEVISAVTSTQNSSDPKSKALTVNSAYDGVSDINLLDGSDTLEVGEYAVVSFAVRVIPDKASAPYLNSAKVTAVSPSNTTVTDFSNNGTDPDPDGDGWANEQQNANDINGDSDTIDDGEGVMNDDGSIGNGATNDENAPTPIPIDENPIIGLGKIIDNDGDGAPDSNAVDNGDGTFTVTYVMTVENLGNTTLENVQITDDLTRTFPTGVTLVSVSDPVSSGAASLTPNTSFDGDSDKNILMGSDSLASGAVGQVIFKVTINPNDVTGPFMNSATASGVNPDTNTKVQDVSTNNSNPDPDDNNLPTEGSPTPANIVSNAAIGVAKQLMTIDSTNAPTYTAKFAIRLENIGNVDLHNIQVTDKLKEVFGASFASASATLTTSPTKAGSSISLNTSFDGESDTDLLDSGAMQKLEPGDFAIIELSATVDIKASYGPYYNQASVSATTPENQRVTDLSDDGIDADANKNGNPGDTNEDDPTSVTFIPASDLEMEKLQAIAQSADDTTAITDCDAATFTRNPLTVNPGEYICYKITATNSAASSDMLNVVLNDYIDPDLRDYGGGLVSGSFKVDDSGLNGGTATLECSVDGFITTTTCPTTGVNDDVSDIRVKIDSLKNAEVVTFTYVVFVQ